MKPRAGALVTGRPEVGTDDLLAPRFLRVAAAYPDRVAVVAAGGTTTYRELHDTVGAIARAVALHRRIALLPRSDAASLAVTLGAMVSGVSIVVLDRHLTDHQIDRAITLADPGLVIAPSGRRRSIHERATAGRLRTPEHLIAAGRAASPVTTVAAPEDELLIGLTSGTTGDPKLFVRNQASWATTLDRSDTAFDIRSGDVVSTPGPLDHSHYFYGALHALTRGATVDLRPVEAAFAPGEAPTHVYVVPTLAVQVGEALAGRTAPSVRHVVSSAATWPDTARKRLKRTLPNATVHHFYGASELSFVALDSSTERADTGTAATSQDERSSSAGVLFPGVEVEIRDPHDGLTMVDGEQGIVHVRSDMLFDGYLSTDGLTDGPDPDGWATVGDLGTLRGDRLWIAGRASDTFTLGGINVEPADVEQAIGALDGVREAACVGMPDDYWGAIPVVALVVDAGGGPSRSQVRAHARATLPQPSRPWRIFVVDALPRNRRGKLRRRDLVAQIAAADAARDYGSTGRMNELT